MPPRPRLYLIDGSGYIFRAYYAIRPLSTRAGVPTNAVVGFAKMLGKLIKEEQPHLLGIAFDTREKSFRHELYEAYKANRDVPPEDLAPQFDLIFELVHAMDIPSLAVPGYEADDVLATLAHKAVDMGYDIVLVSGDKDLMQLVGPHVAMFDPMKDKHYGPAEVEERFGVPPEHVLDVLALSGDTSDNIPGVPKVGPKSAAKLVSEYGNVEAVIAGLQARETLKLKAYERSVLEHTESARLSRRLASLAFDAPVSLDTDKLTYGAPRQESLAPFLRKIEAVGLLREFGYDNDGAVAPPVEGSTPVLASPRPQLAVLDAPPVDRSNYRMLLTYDELQSYLQKARALGELAVDLETTSLDPNRADIVGVALACGDEPAVYVPVAHRYLGAPKQLPCKDVLACLAPLLSDPAVGKVGQHLKYDMVALTRAGVALRGVQDDSMLAAYVLDPTRASYSLDTLAREVLGHDTIRYQDVTGRGKSQIGFDEVDVEAATRYAAEDADVALRLCHALTPKVKDAGLEELYRKLELPLVPVLAAMERAGVKVDKARLVELGMEFTTRLAEIEQRAHAIIGGPINLASPKQLADLFFNKMGMTSVKKTKSGHSTDQEVLEVLAREHELPRVVLEHRMLSKLKSTYVDALCNMVNPQTGRVHTSYNQTGTATGRLSSSDPNLQNIPVRSDDGRRIRAAFVAEDNCLLIAADYSQIELRVMAHLSQDHHFIEAFKQGEDIHERTAREILTGGTPASPEARRRAKAINFGILYGLSEFGLAKQLDIPKSEANAYIRAYFARYPGIRAYLDYTIDEARERGYVSTLLGRRRYLPDLSSKNRMVRQGAERVAMNTPIQGSAADIIKLAMLRVANSLEEAGLCARLLLQVHDELVVEAPQGECDAVIALLRREMEGVLPLRVPLLVDIGVGPDWASAH